MSGFSIVIEEVQQQLTAGLRGLLLYPDWLSIDQDTHELRRFGSTIDPGVSRSALDNNVKSLQMDFAFVQYKIDLFRQQGDVGQL